MAWTSFLQGLQRHCQSDLTCASTFGRGACRKPHQRPNRAMCTELEGSRNEISDVVKRATEAVEPFGSRVSLVMKADIRPGFEGELEAKLDRLEAALEDY